MTPSETHAGPAPSPDPQPAAPPRPPSDYLECSIHALKTHISRYLRLLEEGRYKAVIVRRYNRPVAFFMPIKPQDRARLIPGERLGDRDGAREPRT
jgi:antitoxin (DNA-binding transcriptional repressor) of toxin-antitoxin stability system